MTTKSRALAVVWQRIKWLVNLQKCCWKCHHKTALVWSVQVGASGHSLTPAAGLLRSIRRRKTRLVLRCAPTPQIRENSHRRAIPAYANPLFAFQRQLSTRSWVTRATKLFILWAERKEIGEKTSWNKFPKWCIVLACSGFNSSGTGFKVVCSS